MIIGVPALLRHSFIDAAWKLIELWPARLNHGHACKPCDFERAKCGLDDALIRLPASGFGPYILNRRAERPAAGWRPIGDRLLVLLLHSGGALAGRGDLAAAGVDRTVGPRRQAQLPWRD